MVSDQERQNIALATKAQSNCQAWFEHRRVRITASQSKRALIKPSTSPTKAMKEILHYNNQYQSNKMKQGLKDEKKIILEYETNWIAKSVKQVLLYLRVILSLGPLQMGR